MAKEVKDKELKQVICDFLEMGHVENIVAMFRQDKRYYDWIGEFLQDERFVVRLGVSVLFEYLIVESPEDTPLALPSLKKIIDDPRSWVRGEVASVLGIIANQEAIALLKKLSKDSDKQVAAIAKDLLPTSNKQE